MDFCRFAESFAEETELPVWQSLLQGLAWCERFLTDGPREHFRSWIRGLLWPAIERIGWEPREGERDLDKPLRGALMAALGVLGADPQAFGIAMEIEREARGDGQVDPSLVAASVAIVAAGGTPEDFERYLEAIGSARTPQEELRYLYALPDFRDAGLVQRTVEMTLSGEIRTQNAPGVLARAVANREHGDRAWAFVKEHWDEIVSKPRADDARLRGRRRSVPHRARAGRGRRHVLRGAPDPAVGAPAPADPRAPAREPGVPRARDPRAHGRVLGRSRARVAPASSAIASRSPFAPQTTTTTCSPGSGT